MINRLDLFFRSALQNIIILIVRPYVIRELPGWGRLYAAFVGDYRRNWLWAGAPIKSIRGKRHGFVMQLDLSKWPDRSAFFLGRWYDLGTQLLLSDLVKSGDTVVDIGANRGMFALVASRLVGDAGKVICFEPNPNCFKILDREIASNKIKNIIVHRVGLGHQEEALTLLVPVLNSGEGTFGKSAYGNDATYQVHAQVKRGDQILANEKPALIKIDVEGFECNVITGLAEIINRGHPLIVTEVVPKHLAQCGFSVAELVALMENFDYQGFSVGLTKNCGRYTWQLASFKIQDRATDVIWLHRETMRHNSILHHHAASPPRT